MRLILVSLIVLLFSLVQPASASPPLGYHDQSSFSITGIAGTSGISLPYSESGEVWQNDAFLTTRVNGWSEGFLDPTTHFVLIYGIVPFPGVAPQGTDGLLDVTFTGYDLPFVGLTNVTYNGASQDPGGAFYSVFDGATISGIGAGGSQSIPEPTGLCLVSASSLLLLWRQRR